MQPSIFVHNIQLSPRLQDYVEKRAGKLDRYMPDMTELRVDLSRQNARNISERNIAQITVRDRHGTILRAEERDGEIFAAIDSVVDKMYRQIKRYRGKLIARRRHAVTPEVVALDVEPLPIDEEEVLDDAASIVRSKRFSMEPMSPEEAIDQMELLGHDFFVFFNMQEEAINVLYRRRDGNYGLLMPEMA
jgi:putative sigma-54 modulation protein